jgi:hypothetical protein
VAQTLTPYVEFDAASKLLRLHCSRCQAPRSQVRLLTNYSISNTAVPTAERCGSTQASQVLLVEVHDPLQREVNDISEVLPWSLSITEQLRAGSAESGHFRDFGMNPSAWKL